jgi:S-DNA-T family DNA segregation ATPase FtsK/SpoIIIE
MLDRSRLKLDVAACALLLLCLGLLLCVLGFQPAHTQAVFPPRESSPHLLGPIGHWLGLILLETFGLGVYVFLAGWFVLVVMLLLRRGLVKWTLRCTGWLLLILCTAVASDNSNLHWSGSPITGNGGSLGAWLSSRLSAHFDPPFQVILVSVALVLGLVLAMNFVLAYSYKILGRIVSRTAKIAARLLSFLQRNQTQVVDGETANSRNSQTDDPFPSSSPNNDHIPINHPRPIGSKDTQPEKSLAGAAPFLAPIARSGPTGDAERFADFELPPLSLLEVPEPFPYEEQDQRLRERAAVLEKTFTDFGLNVKVVGINTGPVITQYEVALETGLRLHKVTRLADDLALNLKVTSVRMVAPIPGKNTVGVEIPNEHRAVVRLKEVILTAGQLVANAKVPMFLGKDTEGRPLVYDLAEMPHLLIAGRTGTGKSVCMNAIILSILMTRRPDEVKMIMIDPKMLELSEYGKIPHLMHPVVKDMKKAEAILSWAVDKMEERYDILSRARVRSIAAYNELTLREIRRRVNPVDEEERSRFPDRMPYIVIFVDEINDLLMTMKKEVEGHIIRLAQKSRAAGIHLVVATQKPTVDVITGLIKSNLPARICFQVSSRSDSRVVLDEMGADKLLGKGDMLFLQPGSSTIIRAQGTYLSDEEISRVVEHLECDPCYLQELIQLSATGKDGKGGFLETLRARDEVYEPAIEVVIREGRGSVSLLQRALGIGYGRAARLIDFMAEDGIVGNYNGSQAREVLFTPEQWEQMKQNAQAEERVGTS